MKLISILLLACLASLTLAQSGRDFISYHIYGSDKISGSCDYYNPPSVYGGYITATTHGLPCYSCVKMTSGGKSIHVTTVDTGGRGFDLNEPAFVELCGAEGIRLGGCDVSWQVVAAGNCIRPGGTPNPSSGGSGGSKIRCGSSWTAANGRCGKSCTNDGGCTGGEKCYADLATTPCSTGADDQMTSAEDGTIPYSSWVVALIVIGSLILILMVALQIQLIYLLRR